MLRLIMVLLLLPNLAFAAIITGNKEGSVNLKFVYDYQCHFCHATFGAINEVLRAKPDVKVSLYPVAILNKDSLAQAKIMAYLAMKSADFNNINKLVLSSQKLGADEFLSLIKNTTNINIAPTIDEQQQISSLLKEGELLMKQNNARGVPLIVIEKNGRKKVLRGKQSKRQIIWAINHV